MPYASARPLRMFLRHMAVIFNDPMALPASNGRRAGSTRVAPMRATPQSPATPLAPRMTLGRILLERNLITETQLEAAITHQKRSGNRLGQALVDLDIHDARRNPGGPARSAQYRYDACERKHGQRRSDPGTPGEGRA